MRIKTTGIEIGKRYEYRRSGLDVVNEALFPCYPSGVRWMTADAGQDRDASRPTPGAVVTVVADEVTGHDRRGDVVRPTNYRGRPFVGVRDDHGATHVPVDPQYLYPLDEVREGGLTKAAYLLFWVVLFPIGVAALIFGIQWLAEPPAALGKDASRTAALSLGVGVVITSVAGWWLLRIRAERKAEGTWSGSLKAGLLVGCVLAVAALMRAFLGLD